MFPDALDEIRRNVYRDEKDLNKRKVLKGTKVIEMEVEGSVMSASGNLPDVEPGGNGMKTNSSRSRYNAASSNELEDMINDILTVDP